MSSLVRKMTILTGIVVVGIVINWPSFAIYKIQYDCSRPLNSVVSWPQIFSAASPIVQCSTTTNKYGCDFGKIPDDSRICAYYQCAFLPSFVCSSIDSNNVTDNKTFTFVSSGLPIGQSCNGANNIFCFSQQEGYGPFQTNGTLTISEVLAGSNNKVQIKLSPQQTKNYNSSNNITYQTTTDETISYCATEGADKITCCSQPTGCVPFSGS